MLVNAGGIAALYSVQQVINASASSSSVTLFIIHCSKNQYAIKSQNRLLHKWHIDQVKAHEVLHALLHVNVILLVTCAQQFDRIRRAKQPAVLTFNDP